MVRRGSRGSVSLALERQPPVPLASVPHMTYMCRPTRLEIPEAHKTAFYGAQHPNWSHLYLRLVLIHLLLSWSYTLSRPCNAQYAHHHPTSIPPYFTARSQYPDIGLSRSINSPRQRPVKRGKQSNATVTKNPSRSPHPSAGKKKKSPCPHRFFPRSPPPFPDSLLSIEIMRLRGDKKKTYTQSL